MVGVRLKPGYREVSPLFGEVWHVRDEVLGGSALEERPEVNNARRKFCCSSSLIQVLSSLLVCPAILFVSATSIEQCL
jgi:hypothetical protein